jgi:hypothetical protein
MESHVFAVWDFMSLVRSLERQVCGNRLPWLPPANPLAARLINEILVAEETDAVGAGFKSHFELYCDAMREVGADVGQILKLQDQVRRLAPGEPFARCLDGLEIGDACRAFVEDTFAVLTEPPHVQAAVFFHAREGIIPAMFSAMVQALAEEGLRCGILVDYLERHIHTDEELHGPMALRLLEELYAGSIERRELAELRAIRALEARVRLWDEIAAKLTGT